MRSISARLSVSRNAVSSSLVAPCLDKTSVKLIPQLDEAAAWILCVMVGVLRLKRLRLKRLRLKFLRLCVKRLLDAPHLLEHACDGGELPRRPGREGARSATMSWARRLARATVSAGSAGSAWPGGASAPGASPLPLPGVGGGGGSRRKARSNVLSGGRRSGQPCCSRKA